MLPQLATVDDAVRVMDWLYKLKFKGFEVLRSESQTTAQNSTADILEKPQLPVEILTVVVSTVVAEHVGYAIHRELTVVSTGRLHMLGGLTEIQDSAVKGDKGNPIVVLLRSSCTLGPQRHPPDALVSAGYLC